MIDLADIRAKLQRAWQDGNLMREWLSDSERWPCRFSARPPSGMALLKQYDEVQAWIARLEQTCRVQGLRIVYADVRALKLGVQLLPAEIWVDHREDALVLIGKSTAFERFEELVAITRRRRPELLDWVSKRPLRALELATIWTPLLDLVDWFVRNPASGLYLRQIDVPSIDTKFVETHLGVIAELVGVLRPDDAAPGASRMMRSLAVSMGLAFEQPSIRLRLLDPALVAHYCGVSDLTIPLGEFKALDPPCSTVFLTENKTNGLAFPNVLGSLVVFGLGYGIDSLREIPWLKHRRLIYWGDIDTHGYHILSRCREYWPHVESMLMDEAVLRAWIPLAGEEPEQSRNTSMPLALRQAESAAFTALIEDRYGFHLRIEQERIPFHAIVKAIHGTSSLS
ncbi:MAG: Wadjet anti-phage system protein JetD domain-containing protein [Solimonas sp.]